MDSELFKPFKLCFWVFKSAGMWQDGNQSWTYFIAGYLVHFVLIDIYLVCQFIYAFKAENLIDLVDALGLTTTYLSEICKCINFFAKLKLIKKLLETLEALLKFSADERFANRNHVRVQVAFSLKVYKMFWFSAFMTCCSGAFVPIFSHQMPYKVWFPFNTEYSSTGFWIASYYLVLNSFYVSAVDMALDILPVIFISFAIGLIDELSDRLAQVGNIQALMKVRNSQKCEQQNIQELINCIKIHKKITEFVGEIRSNFAVVIFAQGLMSSIILCTSAFTMSVVSINEVT